MKQKAKRQMTTNEFFVLIRNAGKRIASEQQNLGDITEHQYYFEESQTFYDVKRDWSYPLEIKLEN